MLFSRLWPLFDYWSNVTAPGVFWLVAEEGSKTVFLSCEEFTAQQKASLKELWFLKHLSFIFQVPSGGLYNWMFFSLELQLTCSWHFTQSYFQCYRRGAIGCFMMTAWSHFSAGSVLLLMAPIYSLQVRGNGYYNLHCLYYALVWLCIKIAFKLLGDAYLS